MFWESLTGIPLKQTDQHHFRTVDCCINSERLYANIQVSNAADRVEFNFEDQSKWKHMSHESILSMKKSAKTRFSFQPCILKDISNQEIEMEMGLKQYIFNYRQDHDLCCIWDDDLGHLLGQSLWSLEVQKLAGSHVSVFNEDFQHSVKRAIPEGHTFKVGN